MNAVVKQPLDPVGLSPDEARKFSVSKLMRAMLEPAWGEKNAGLELEACRATSEKYGENGGYSIPPEVRALTATGGVAAGGALVETQVETEWWAHALAFSAKVIQLGAQVVTSANSVALPRLKPGQTPAAVAENAALAESDPTFEQTVYAPKTLTNNITVSRRLLVTAGTIAETVVRADMAEAMAVLIDLYAIAGAGGNQPTGILNTGSLTTVSLGANGAAPTFANIIDMERQLGFKKGARGSLGFLGNNKVRATMRAIVKTSGFDFLWQDGEMGTGHPEGQVLGYPAFVSDNVPSNLVKGASGAVLSALIFGNWADLYIVQFGPQSITLDPYSGSSSGAVRFNIFQEVDIAPRHVDSFAAIVDMVAA
jgi:HK97 family phage major capsid protein